MVNPYLGQIALVGFSFAPRSWATCSGQLLPIAQNQALFSLLGTAFGGDGRTTFALPDLRGRVPVGVGTGPGLDTVNWGQKGGAETIALTNANLPSHNHTVRVNSGLGNKANSAGFHIAQQVQDEINTGQTGHLVYGTTTGGGTLDSGTITNSGGGIPLDNWTPSLGIYYCIAIQGIFPSRN